MDILTQIINNKSGYPTISVSFDFETSAQTDIPSYRAKLKSWIYRITNNAGITNKDLSAGIGRGYANRKGAERILEFLGTSGIKATWFCTGHVLLKENRDGKKYRINQKLPYASIEGGFTKATSWRKIKSSFYHDPLSDYHKYPYYYLGDLAEKIKIFGHDIQCHSFSHPYISMESHENIKIDLEDWQNCAMHEGFETAKIFAFPFLGDFHYELRDSDIKVIPAFLNGTCIYDKKTLDDKTIEIFRNQGIELFTRCGSMFDSKTDQSFSRYHGSSLYCIKDIPILSFKDLSSFKVFLDELAGKRANLDLWLHPDDIIVSEKFHLFTTFILELVKRRDKGELVVSTINEQWRDYKKEFLT